MKIHLKYTAIIIAALSLGSCNILDIDPNSAVLQDDVFTDEDGIKSTVVGCYDALQSSSYYGRYYTVAPDLLSYNLAFTGTTQDYAELQNNAVQPSNPIIEGIWASIYDGINRTNMVFANIDQAGLPTQKENYYLGHCHFLRALHYFNLVRMFGEVPIKLNSTTSVGDNLNIAKSSIADVYQQIEDDLEDAITYLSLENVDLFEGQATPNTARALMSKVKLYEEDWTGAISYANEVINQYMLVDIYEDLFPPDHNSESIFEISYSETDNNVMAQYFLPTSIGGRQEYTPTDTIINVFAEADSIRFKTSIADNDIGLYVNKYKEIATRSDNIYVLRLAEIYLIRAEAEARLPGTITNIQNDINEVRVRAGLDETTADTFDELLLEIEAERQKEFAFEGERWFDLVRTNRAIEVIANVTNTDQYLMPIPLSEMQTNSAMTQNSGYE